jgi:hypothetical protein
MKDVGRAEVLKLLVVHALLHMKLLRIPQEFFLGGLYPSKFITY